MTKFVVDTAGTTTIADHAIVPHIEERFVVNSKGEATPTMFHTARFIETTR